MSVELTIETVEETIVLELQDHVPAVLTIDNIPELRDELDSKVDKEVGMGLSELSFTTVDKLNLDQSEQDRHTHNNKPVIDGLSDDAGVLQYKGLPIIDQAALDAKVDKVAGYSLVDDAEIEKLSTVEEYAQKNLVSSVAGKQGDVLLDKSDVGLSAVDNTADADKPVSTAVADALAGKVDAEAGKQLSDENYTLAEKDKLSGIAEQATKNRADSDNADKVHEHVIEDVTGLTTRLNDIDALISQYINQFMPWNPSALFMRGDSGVWYRPSVMSTLFQSSDGATPVVSIGDPVGLMLDKSGNDNHATQAASSFRPTYTLDPSGASVLLEDDVDDALITPPATYSGTSYINTSYGWYKSSVQEGVAASLPLTWLREYVAREGAASVADDDKMRSYFATEQKLMIVMTRNLVVSNLRMFSGGSATTVVAIGNNGVTAEKQLSLNANETWDLSADGLTAPALLVFDSNPALSQFYCITNKLTGSIPDLSSNLALSRFFCHTNRLTGSIPDLSSNTSLAAFECHINRLTGSIPDLSSNTSLAAFRCEYNQLTGSIPDLSSNASLVIFNCQGNQLTGSIPDLSSNASLVTFNCHTNQLTGWSGGSVSSTLGSFEAQNNLLTQTAVDGLLVAFDAAGRATGALNLGGTTNSTPSATGKTAADNLRAKGWTVTLNGY